jgi:uncharacterized protein (DUF1697 family)
MTVYIGLLRAVNLGSHKKVAMSDLKAMVEGLGFADARTLLQSGNVVFRGSGATSKVEKVLEDEARRRLALDTEFIVRTAEQWDDVIDRNPFPKEAKADPGRFVVLACKTAPGKDLKVTGANREVWRADGREVYIVYPDGQGTSRLKIHTVGTARNWNTVLKLADAARQLQSPR